MLYLTFLTLSWQGMNPPSLLAIEIPFDPNIISSGGFTLSWHGLLSFVGVAVAVYLIARWAKRDGIEPDVVYNTAIWAILGGIIGARIVHVADNWHLYSNDLGSVFAIWSGGIGLWGAILGGWLAGVAYAYVAKYPIGKLMDLAAPAMLIGQSVGRIGDIINGEHWSRATELPWGWFFSHPESPGRIGAIRLFGDGDQPVHPTVFYEIIWNMVSLAIVWKLRGRLKPDGSIWMLYLTLYAIGRFSVQWLRLDPVKFWGLQEAHIIAILVLLVTIPYLVLKTRFVKPGEEPDDPSSQRPTTRRERRERARERARDRA